MRALVPSYGRSSRFLSGAAKSPTAFGSQPWPALPAPNRRQGRFSISMSRSHGSLPPMRTTLVIATYNWKEALSLVLRSAATQSRLPDEVIVADDGSQDDTRALISGCARDYPVPLRHVWQEDLGFRVARSRNRAIAAARGDYILLVDGDMVLHRHFVADHLYFAAPSCVLQGGRLRASPRETARLLAGGRPRFNWALDGDFTGRWEFKRRHALRWRWLAWCSSRLH